jgi:hypothetical protein
LEAYLSHDKEMNHLIFATLTKKFDEQNSNIKQLYQDLLNISKHLNDSQLVSQITLDLENDNIAKHTDFYNLKRVQHLRKIFNEAECAISNKIYGSFRQRSYTDRFLDFIHIWK